MYERIPGGEKTAKTGVKWTEGELRNVLDLYVLIDGKQIHERNPLIQELGKRLGRSTRSVENQLLIFRGLDEVDRGGSYTRKNMNKLCKKLWEERKGDVTMQTDSAKDCQIEVENTDLFPDGFFKWAGHRDGGVRRPFDELSGRPTGEQIETPLVKRLHDWASDIAEEKNVPRSILLVGGPGNGKTDTIEGCIQSLDHMLNAKGELVDQFRQQYAVAYGQLPPRKVTVDLAGYDWSKPLGPHTSISLVQDATEGDPTRGRSAEQLLLEDINRIAEPDSPGIYLCCVNRGILARTATLAVEEGQTDTVKFLDSITDAVTSGPKTPRCWPLEGFKHTAVWPMDVESLVQFDELVEPKSVAHQIFSVVLDDKKWKQPCELGTKCPFCQNKKLLSKKGAIDSLVKMLRSYELSSGKRWTFRDLFSLISHLFVGDFSELEIKGKRVSPCQWAKEQWYLAEHGKLGSTERDRAPYMLMSRLYHHRLFPRWPSFNRGEYRDAKKELFKPKHSNEGLLAAKAVFRFAERSADLTAKASGDVPELLRDSLGPSLDPALVTGNEVLIERNGEKITAEKIEDMFSLSVAEGLELVKTQVEPLERSVLGRLSGADAALTEDNFPRANIRQARVLQATLRQLAIRIVKRSLGCRRGVCRNASKYRDYEKVICEPKKLKKVRRQLSSLLHDSENNFRAGLATTFGQPVAERSRDVVLLTSKITIGEEMPQKGEGRPVSYLPYLVIKGHYVALTFDLFKALDDISKGLHEASLSAEIYSLLDRVKSVVAGRVIRDPQVLDELPRIVFGTAKKYTIEYDGGSFDFLEGDE